MSTLTQWTYNRRDPISWFAAVGLGMALTFLGPLSQKLPHHASDVAIAALLELPTAPEHEVTKSRAVPVTEKTLPSPKAEPSKVAPKPMREQVMTTPVSTSAQAPSPVTEGRSDAPLSAPVPTPTPTYEPLSTVREQEPIKPSLSAQYEAELLAYLERIKRYPTSREARLTQPKGTVRLKLEIARSGELVGAEVLTSSGSNLLDGEALRTVRGVKFPSFGEQAFVGEATHRFSVGLKYQIEGQ